MNFELIAVDGLPAAGGRSFEHLDPKLGCACTDREDTEGSNTQKTARHGAAQSNGVQMDTPDAPLVHWKRDSGYRYMGSK